MKIDWNELNKGIASALEKSAAPKGGFKKPLIGAGGMAAGAGVAGLGASAMGGMMSGGGLGSLAGYLPALLPLLASGKPKNLQQRPPVIHVHTGRRPTVLDSLPENQVGSVNNMNTGQPIKVAGDPITDALAVAVKSRLANKAIDVITNKSKAENAVHPDTDAKKIEIVSKYPEMAHLLEKEENRAYLEKLLKE
jgi:hypothetical protein